MALPAIRHELMPRASPEASMMAAVGVLPVIGRASPFTEIRPALSRLVMIPLQALSPNSESKPVVEDAVVAIVMILKL
jgi:hypothetical protein